MSTLKARFIEHEGPTWVVALGVYGAWLTLVLCHEALPWWVLLCAGAYVIALQFSLQHEAIHGWKTCPQALRHAIVWPPIGLWLPFALYKRSHSTHHRNPDLTFPGKDTESVYHRADDWAHYCGLYRGLLMVNQTFFGRLLIGPPIRLWKLVSRDLAPLVRGEFRDLSVWAAHAVGVALILWFVTAVAGIALWEYLLLFAYPGMVLGWVRPFLEHRYGERPYERVAAIESNWFFGLLFLWNNLHIVHHRHPTMPWFQIPGYYRAHHDALLEMNGHYVYSGYWELIRRFSTRSVFIPIHPRP